MSEACAPPGSPAEQPVQGPRNSFAVSEAGETTLITRPDIRESLTFRQETDARTALVRGLAEYLRPRRMESPAGLVEFKAGYFDHAEPEERAQRPSFSVMGVGMGQYEPVHMTPIVFRDPLTPKRHLVTPAEYTLNMTVQLFCTNPQERMMCSALLEAAIYPVSWMAGFRLQLPFYFNSYATFEPQGTEYRDSPDTAVRRERNSVLQLVGRVRVLQVRSHVLGVARFEPQVGPDVDV